MAQRAFKILIVSSLTLPLGFIPLLWLYDWKTYVNTLMTMGFAAFIPTAFVLYMYETVLCMAGFKRGNHQFWRQMGVAVGFAVLIMAILWLSNSRIKLDTLTLQYRGLILVPPFMLFGAIINNVWDTQWQ